MRNKVKQLFLALLCVVSISSVVAPSAVYAAATPFKSDACKGVNTLTSDNPSANCGSSSAIDNVIKVVIQVLSAVVGIAAVIMIIIGGHKYVTSNGDSSAISSAKNTVLYALIGLVIVALAQVMVHFVLTKTAQCQIAGKTSYSASDPRCK